MKKKIPALLIMNILFLILIGLFYHYNPILEYKKLSLNGILEISREPNDKYSVTSNGLPMYVSGIKKYREKWIGDISECYVLDDHQIEYYARPKNGNEAELLTILEEDCDIINKDYAGYFYIDEKGNIEYNLQEKELIEKIQEEAGRLNEKIELKDPNYYIQRYGYEKDINESYFSADTWVNITQNPQEVKRRAIMTRNILYSVSVFSLLVLAVFFIKDIRFKRKINSNKSNF